MKFINRRELSLFISRHFKEHNEGYSDLQIDEKFKEILSKAANGKDLSGLIVAHLEYFMNTLNFDHKSKTKNPFENPEEYPALMYKIGEGSPIADVIMENYESSSDEGMEEFPRVVIISDNDLIDHSQLNNAKTLTQNPESLSAQKQGGEKLASIKSSNSPIKSMVRNEIKRQSMILVNNMTVIERHNYIIHPTK
jgi:succinate dehydrogenase flavin-adding protein (antitoxin of CptAB toxin-antitoxin module)